MTGVKEQDKHSEDTWLRSGAGETVGEASVRRQKVQKQQKNTANTEDMLSFSLTASGKILRVQLLNKNVRPQVLVLAQVSALGGF